MWTVCLYMNGELKTKSTPTHTHPGAILASQIIFLYIYMQSNLSQSIPSVFVQQPVMNKYSIVMPHQNSRVTEIGRKAVNPTGFWNQRLSY